MATVTTETQLRSAIQSGSDPEILVANNITVRTYVTVNRSVTVRTLPGNPTATLFWSPASGMSNQYLFRVYSSGNLMVDTLTMDGQGRNCGLVRLSGGVFTMNDGTTLTGIKSNTSNSAVLVGDMMSAVGGSFVMNGGLITGVDAGPHTTVFCAGGTILMSGDAAIDNNPSNGITAMDNLADGTRSTVKITGNARITNNTGGQSGGGIMSLRSDIVIGETDADAPQISGNYSPFHAGGIVALQATNLSIGGNAQISGNSSLLSSGAILAQAGSTLRIGGNAKVANNKSGGSSGGISITSNTTAVFEGNAQISGNTAGDETVAGGAGIGSGGGVLLQTGATLEVGGNVSISDNTAENGGGIYLTAPLEGSAYGPPSAVIGAGDSSPSVYGNTAASLGGGIYVADQTTLSLTGQSQVYENTAPLGNGVYNDGILNMSGSAEILDGLYFDCVPADGFGDPPADQPADTVRFEPADPGEQPLEVDILVQLVAASLRPDMTGIPFADSDDDDPSILQCDKAPIIDEPLSPESVINIEISRHVTPGNVPLVIANGDPDTIPLIETDRAACRIPREFGPGYAVMITPGRDQIIIDAITYAIVYNELHGAANSNPASYRINRLPVTFVPPGERPGYAFTGWQDAEGNPVTAIPEGSTGDLTLTALWQTQTYNIVYNGLSGGIHSNPVTYNVERLPIRLRPARERPGYTFTGWLDPAGNPVTAIPEGSTGDLVFTAVWQAQAYSIAYLDLFGAAHSNPASYSIDDLPIQLAPPSDREGYTFTGWRNTVGAIVTEIPVGSTGDLAFTAVWQARPYNIAYLDLFGAAHSNPVSYSADDLPITLAPPSDREGYTFTGWRDGLGAIVTEIPVGSTGDLAFTAVWAEHSLSFDGNAPCVCNVPATIRAENGTARIPNTRPCRPCHIFLCWKDLESGKIYCPGNTVDVSGGNVKLYAQWTLVCCCG